MTKNSMNTPVVLVHGMWSTGETLCDLKAAFELQGYTVHTPSLPWHIPLAEHTDETKQKLARTSIQEYADFLCEFIEKLETKPILVGHSMGGLVSQLAASRVTLEKLVLISSASPAGINSWSWSVIRTFGHNLFKPQLWKKTTDLRLASIQYGIANTQNGDIQADIASDSTFESGRASNEIGLWFLFRNPPTRVDYSRINCPVLVLSGLKDKITPPKIQRKIHENYCKNGKSSTLKLLPGVCQWTIGGSNFDTVCEELFAWLGTLEATEVKETKAA